MNHTFMRKRVKPITPLVKTIQKDVNQIQVHNLYDDNIFVDIWEKGVGYVPSCGTGAAAAALFSDKDMVEVYCRGGKYIIEKDYYRWSMTAENIS